MQDVKVCCQCGEMKPTSEFRLNNRTKDGYTAACKDCLNQKQNKVRCQKRLSKCLKCVESLPDEIWKPIPGYDGYEASSFGRIKKSSQPIMLMGGEIMSDEYLLTPQMTYQGYLTVCIKGYPRFVHRLAALAFIPNPNNYPCVNHKDENKSNPLPGNLEWCDVKYNTNYGTSRLRYAITRGSKIVQYTIDGDFVAEYYSMGAAASAIGVKSAGNICECCKGRRTVAYGYVWKYKES